MSGTGLPSRLSIVATHDITNHKIVNCMHFLNEKFLIITNIDAQFRVIYWIKKNMKYDIGFLISREKDSTEFELTLSISIHYPSYEITHRTDPYLCVILFGVDIYDFVRYIVNGDMDIGNNIRDRLTSYFHECGKESSRKVVKEVLQSIQVSTDFINTLHLLDQLLRVEIPIIETGLDEMFSEQT